MSKKKKGKMMQIVDAARQKMREDYLESLRDGRKQRAQTFKPKKGKGSYDRKNKDW